MPSIQARPSGSEPLPRTSGCGQCAEAGGAPQQRSGAAARAHAGAGAPEPQPPGRRWAARSGPPLSLSHRVSRQGFLTQRLAHSAGEIQCISAKRLDKARLLGFWSQDREQQVRGREGEAGQGSGVGGPFLSHRPLTSGPREKQRPRPVTMRMLPVGRNAPRICPPGVPARM